MTAHKKLLHHRNRFLRKGYAKVLEVPRAIQRARGDNSNKRQHPSVLCNSFPKSGTHLLLQVLESLPHVFSYGSFLASLTSSRLLWERSKTETIREINRIAPGEVLPGHLHYQPSYQQALADRNVLHFYIMRDPRDVVVSEAHYLTSLNRWHRLHPHYRQLENLEERVSASILGVRTDDGIHYPNVAERFEAVAGWRKNESVCWLSFEALVSGERRSEIERVVEFYAAQATNVPVGATVDAAIAAINPEGSVTFRAGRKGGWRDVFTSRLVDEMKGVAGELLIDLGYEDDLDW